MTTEATRPHPAALDDGQNRVNGHYPSAPVNTAMVEVAQSRAAQETQAAMAVARRFPRDQSKAYASLMTSCQRVSLAESAVYAYPRGTTTVTGPSIRLAEAIAQVWGNLDFGIIELEQRHGESTVMAYCWDLESNTRQTKIFQVPHVRFTRSGGKQALTDPRDIYEMVANQGARRLRACILGIIPGDVIEAAVDKCEDTLKTGHKEPLVDRLRKMLTAFNELGISKEMLEKRLQHNLDATIEAELVNLRSIYNSIKDGHAKREEFFELATPEPQPEGASKSDSLGSKLKGGKKPDSKTEVKPNTPEHPDGQLLPEPGSDG